MDPILIFTDAATSSQMNIAVGAFLCLDQKFIQNHAECSIEDLYAKLDDLVVYQQYVSKKSTWSEIKIAVDAAVSITATAPYPYMVDVIHSCSLIDVLLHQAFNGIQAFDSEYDRCV